MGQYFKRLAHRTGLLNTASHTRQTGPAAVHRDVMEISQETTIPVDATEYASGGNTVRAPTDAASIRAEAIGERHSADNAGLKQAAASTASMHPPVPPRIETPVADLFTNNAKENQDIELSSQESKQLNPDPLFSAERGLLENLISTPSGQQFSETTGSKGPEISGKEKANEANVPLSVSEISALVLGYDERISSSTNASGLSYRTPSPMPEKIPVESSRQNIEIRIGSVTMEVHQKQSAVVMSTSQTRHAGAASSRSNVSSSGFRPNRYYLRGL